MSLGWTCRRAAKAGLASLDWALARSVLAFRPEAPALIAVYFHAILNDSREADKGVVDPSLAVTVGELRRVVEHFLERGHAFLSPADLERALPRRNALLLTFDDGYANNRLAMDALAAYGLPAVYFLSTGHLERGACFWWDVLHRERTRRGAAPSEIRRERRALARLGAAAAEARLRELFGARCLEPVGDLDRPLTPREVAELSGRPGVFWGNHTAGHALLAGSSREAATREIRAAGDWIARVAGAAPTIIAYPAGSYSDETVEIARALGLTAGVTTEARRNRLPLGGREMMRLGRFAVRTGEDVGRQCWAMHCDLSLRAIARGALRGR